MIGHQAIDILSCKNSNITLRPNQVEFLKWFSDNVNNYDVFIGVMPTGDGKRICATSIANFVDQSNIGRTSIIAPQLIHQDDYINEFDWLHYFKGSNNYKCSNHVSATCKQMKQSVLEKYCNGCEYISSKEKTASEKTIIYNIHSYFFNKKFTNFLIVDEAHGIKKFLTDMFSMKIWQPETHFDENAEMTKDLLLSVLKKRTDFLNHHRALAIQHKLKNEIDAIEEEILKNETMVANISLFGDDLIVKVKKGFYDGNYKKEYRRQECFYIYVKPLNVDKLASQFMWPETVDKVVLMSATIGEEDIPILGLSNKRVGVFKSKGSIDPKNRPFYICNVADMSNYKRNESYPRVLSAISILKEKHVKQKGLIHCTYQFSEWLENIAKSNKGYERFIFHNKKNRMEQYNKFRDIKTPAIFVACGMEEGIDLPGELCEWQIITQIMFGYLGDDVNEYNKNNRPELYNLDAVRSIIQQTGRVCRGPTDKGTTYMLDSRYQSLKGRTKSMWPDWFNSAEVPLI